MSLSPVWGRDPDCLPAPLLPSPFTSANVWLCNLTPANPLQHALARLLWGCRGALRPLFWEREGQGTKEIYAAGSVPWRMSRDGVKSRTVLRNSLVRLPAFSS